MFGRTKENLIVHLLLYDLYAFFIFFFLIVFLKHRFYYFRPCDNAYAVSVNNKCVTIINHSIISCISYV